MTDVPLETILEMLGPEVVNLAILLAAALLAAFVATVIVPALPRRRRIARQSPADEVAAPAPPAPSAPAIARRHWSRVSSTVDGEIERTHAIAGFQEAATRQVDAVEFALLGLYADLAAVSSYARTRLEATARPSPAPALQAAA